MSTKFLRRGLLLAMIVPALVTAGCAAGGSGQAMKGAASPASPTATDTGMTESPAPGDSGTASPTDTAAASSPRAAVEKFYEALQSGNADQAAKMFTSDGVAALQGSQTAEGTQALTEAFQNQQGGGGTPNIEESETMGKQNAFVSATSGEGADASRGFFLLKKEGGSWKISRYMSNSAS